MLNRTAIQTVFVVLVTPLVLLAQASAPASAPADADRGGNKLYSTPNDVHGLIMHGLADLVTGTAEARGGEKLHEVVYTSPVLETPFPFNDVVPSWNVDVIEGGGFHVQLRVGNKSGDFWTPWYYLGRWGDIPKPAERILRDEFGIIHTDYFQSKKAFDRLQYRFSLFTPTERSGDGRQTAIRRVAMAYSNTLNDAEVARQFRKPIEAPAQDRWARRIPIPFRSQKWESEALRGQICSPTSVSMVLEHRGVKRPTVEVCERIWDGDYRLYGNWWRAVQGAYSYGVPGYIERFGDWNAVKRHIAEGQPVIASIRVIKGQLRNAPYRESDGHLLVITGFDPDGNVLINDPAGQTEQVGITMYHREDMEKIWFQRGGVGYILQPRTGLAATR